MTSVATARDTRAPSSTKDPIARVVAASMVTGLVSAAGLALVVFAGAGEATILGSSLLGFGMGWAALAELSRRLTTQPQRWAVVPAVAMSATGAAVLGLQPGDHALSSLGWVWPPALLALAVWSARQSRQQLRSRARGWLVTPVIAFLALCAIGGGYETVRTAAVSAHSAPGRMVDIGGRQLHLQCSGTGSPVVVLSSGLGEHSVSWSWITRQVSRTTTVCAYDRAGQVWSDSSPVPPDGAAVAADLHALLHRANLPGPYVLVGHSTGGLYTQVYADRYPGDVAGMVLLDSTSPRAMTALPDYPGFYSMFRRAGALLPTTTRMGLWRLTHLSAGSSLPSAAGSSEYAVVTSARDQRSAHAEFVALRATFGQADRLRTLGDTPLAVVTASKSLQAGWTAEQARLARLSTNSAHVTAPVTHEGMIVERDPSAVSTAATLAVVEAVRTHQPVRVMTLVP